MLVHVSPVRTAAYLPISARPMVIAWQWRACLLVTARATMTASVVPEAPVSLVDALVHRHFSSRAYRVGSNQIVRWDGCVRMTLAFQSARWLLDAALATEVHPVRRLRAAQEWLPAAIVLVHFRPEVFLGVLMILTVAIMGNL